MAHPRHAATATQASGSVVDRDAALVGRRRFAGLALARRVQQRASMRLAFALLASACLTPPDNDVIQFAEDFEACDDLCGWQLAPGVTRVSTYHPGEHAMALAPGAGAQHPIAIARSELAEYVDGNWVELSTDCIGPGALAIGGDPTRLAIEVVLDQRGLGPFTRHYLNFPPLVADTPLTFTSLAITAGDLPCRVDNVQVRISGGTLGY
jgi:hypothetical protein